MKRTPAELNPGDRIAGTYCGARFIGSVIKSRQHTENRAVTLLDIELDSPIEVFGQTRESIHIGYYQNWEVWD